MVVIRDAVQLAAVLRARRNLLGYTQAELARRAHVSRQLIVGLEQGRERAEVGPLLRVVFQLGLDADFREKDEPRSSSDDDDDFDLDEYAASFATPLE